MLKVIKDFFTETDNSTWDLGRVMWACSFLVFVGYSGASYFFMHGNFDPLTFASGIGVILAGGGGGLALKGVEKKFGPNNLPLK